MKHLKHLFTALLLLCTTVATAHDFEVDAIYYDITDATNKTVEVTYRGTSYSEYSNEYTGSVVIPGSVTYDGCTYIVTGIGYNAFYNCSGITSIKIPNSVTSIGGGAFYGCTSLKDLHIADGKGKLSLGYNGSRKGLFNDCPLETLYIGRDLSYDTSSTGGYSPFKNKSTLRYVTISNSVTSIGERAFSDCSGLTSIKIPNSVTSIDCWAFSGCTRLTSIEISNSVTSIGSGAFRDCKSLKELHIADGEGTLSLGNNASNSDGLFYDCPLVTLYLGRNLSYSDFPFSYETTLTSVTIGNSVTSIVNSAFYGCSGLTSITIPNSVTSIGNYAFYGCTGLTSIVVDANNTKYDSRENCNAIIETETNTLILGCNNTVIPNSVTSIGPSAFYGCTGLTSIEIPNSVTSIGGSAFSGCTGLTSITIPNSVTSIGNSAFSGCSVLTSIEIAGSVTSIGNSAFSGCSGLTSVEIPNSVTSIGYRAFEGCTGLASVVIGNSVTSIEYATFSGCTGLTSVVIGNSITTIGERAFDGCSGLTSVEFNAENCTTMGSFSYPVFKNCTALSIVTIGENVKTIPSYAFYDCTGLTSIEIPNSVTTIGERAFSGCTGLTSIEIGNSVTTIGIYAFLGCYGLREVHISDLAAWCGIDFGNYEAQPLYYAENPKNLYLNGELLTELVVPNSVSAIKNHAFRNCSGLTSIEIPNSVTSIGSSAFSGCSGLTSIVIPNSVTSIGEWAFYGCSGLKTVVNLSNLTFSKGSTGNGHVAYYANKIINAPNGFIDGDFIWIENESGMTLAYYWGDATELILPTEYNGKSVTSIGDYAFKNCTGLTGSLVILNSVTSIGTSAFEGCTNIENLYISNSLESIGEKAFADCEKIKEIKIGLEKPIRGAANIFADAVYDNAILYVPTGTKSLYEKREPWNLFFDIVEIDFTGIDEVLDEVKGEDGKVQTVYDLNGRVVEKPANGVYIVNGKKVVIK